VLIASRAAQTTEEAPLSTDADAERRRAANAALISATPRLGCGDLKTLVDCYHEPSLWHYFGPIRSPAFMRASRRR